MRDMDVIRQLGYLLASAVFITGGAQAFNQPAPRAKKASELGLPESQLGVQTNGAVMAVAGTALGLGIFPRVAAAVLAASLVPTTIIGHAFWTKSDPAARRVEQVQFTKNLAMLAALLLIVAEPKQPE
jgi:putative oxidoreductase